jgi:CIC family chloride channel protein
MPAWTRMLQPAMGGMAIGVMLLGAPQVMGVGYEYVDQALNGGLLFKTLVVLCLLKLVATIISYSSGNAGGIFAPSLFIGAMAGGAVGTIVHRVAPFPTGDPGAYALVGMGTLFAGIIRAPMTSVFMIFEITQDYQILVPLMVANLLSFAISKRFQPVPVYHALLHQDDIHLPTAAVRGARPAWTAMAMMRTPASFIAPETTVAATLSLMLNGDAGFLVGTPPELIGIVTLDKVSAAVEAGHGLDRVRGWCEDPVVHVHPDHPLDVVLERFAQSPGLLPVVSREQASRVEGVITLDDVTRFVEGRRTASRQTNGS